MDYTTIVLPVSLLLALLMALTQHTRNNELTAMRAAGISLWRICVPYFIVGLLASAALFGLNELVVPRSTDYALHILGRYTNPATGKATPLDFTNEREGRKWMVRDYHIATGEMLGVQVHWTLPNGQMYILYADSAAHTNGAWTFFNVQEFSQSNDTAVPVPTIRTNVLAMPEFDETSQEIRAEIKIGSYLNFGSQNPNIPLKEILAYLRRHPDLSHEEQGRLLTEMQERLSTPLTCLVVVLIAIPFGAIPGRRNIFVGVAGSIFICFAYFVLQRVSLAFGSNGTWPAWLAAWLPNFFFGALGLILTARIR
jgi:lipopolysaccharide export system permease protein